eukprot:9702890-Heterocapsa_arctica.AAC.1
METLIPKEKGPNIMYIGRLKAEQDRENDAAEVRSDETAGRRSEISHNGRAAYGTTLHCVAKNEDRQEFKNQRSQGKRSRSPKRKTRFQVLQEVRHQGHSELLSKDG